jgi:hypothetical protein
VPVIQPSRPAAAAANATPANAIVQTRKLWSAKWKTVDYLQPLQVLDGVSPQGSQARFAYVYGMNKREDQLVYSADSAPNLDHHFVRVCGVDEHGTTPAPWWYGVIIGRVDQIDSPIGGTTPKGAMAYEAAGLEYLLDRVRIVGAYSGTTLIGYCPTVNLRYARGGSLVGNRSASGTAGAGGRTVYSFGGESVWTVGDFLCYALAHYAPTANGMTWQLAGQVEAADSMKAVFRVEGLTLRQLLDSLLDRRRGLLWFVRTDGTAVTVEIRTALTEPVSIGDLVVPANTDVSRLALDTPTTDPPHITEAVVHTTLADSYHRICVVGERVRSCFTLSYADATLTAGWTPADLALYITALGDDPAANDRYRARKEFDRVLRCHRATLDWNWKAGDGEGTSSENVVPALHDDGTVDTSRASACAPGRRGHVLLSWIPIQSPTTASTTDAEPAYERPLAFAKDPTQAQVSGAYKYVRLDNHGIQDLPTAHVAVLDHEMGVQLEAYGHLFAKNNWAGAGASSKTGGLTGQGDWFYFADLLFTVAAETDTRLQVTVNLGEPVAGGGRTLWIFVPDAHLWYMTRYTVIGVNPDGTLAKYMPAGEDPLGGVVRDDSERLRVIAALAKAWYKPKRQAIRLTVGELTTLASPGAMVQSAQTVSGDEEINTVVTRRLWDFVRRTTTVETEYWELDFHRLAFDVPGIPSAAVAARELAAQYAELNNRVYED